MKSKEGVTAIMLTLLLIGVLASGITVQTAKASGIARAFQESNASRFRHNGDS